MGPIDHSPMRGLWHEVSIPHLPTYNPTLNFMLGITMEETLFGIFLGMLIEGCETTGFHFNEFDRISRFNVWIWNLIESHLQSVNVDIQCIYLHALLIYRYIYIYTENLQSHLHSDGSIQRCPRHGVASLQPQRLGAQRWHVASNCYSKWGK